MNSLNVTQLNVSFCCKTYADVTDLCYLIKDKFRFASSYPGDNFCNGGLLIRITLTLISENKQTDVISARLGILVYVLHMFAPTSGPYVLKDSSSHFIVGLKKIELDFSIPMFCRKNCNGQKIRSFCLDFYQK